MTNPDDNCDDDNRADGDLCPDELAAGRAEFLRLAAAMHTKDKAGVARVLAELSALPAAAWQLALQAAAFEHIGALYAIAEGDSERVEAHLLGKGLAALDVAEEANDRLLGDGS